MRNKDALPGTLLAIRQGAREGVLTLVVAGEERSDTYTVSAKFYESLGSPAAGEVLGEEPLERLRLHVKEQRAVSDALAKLARGDLSRRDLYLKLRQKGHAEREAKRAVSEMERLGYLHEEDAARRLCEVSAAKGWSRKKVTAYLHSRGYDSAVISRAISAAVEAGEADFEANRAAFIRRQEERGLSPDEVRRALWRAGF